MSVRVGKMEKEKGGESLNFLKMRESSREGGVG
jgi:hypothetical protein